MDSFITSFSYGIKNIKIPIKACSIITLTGTLLLAISFLLSSYIQPYLSPIFSHILSFLIFFLLAIHSWIHEYLKKYNKIQFKYKGILIVLNIYMDEINADLDHSFVLSSKEALYLGIVLSIDSFISGFAIGTITNMLFILVISFILNVFLMYIGAILGRRNRRQNHNTKPWLSGTLFFILALCKLFSK